MNRKPPDEQNVKLTDVNKLRGVLPQGWKYETTPIKPQRPDWDTYFLGICDAVAKRADCRRAQHGCVVVRDHRIVATGYNAAPSGGPSCLAGECPRGLLSNAECRSLSSYENCIAIHAEANAIAYANWRDTQGAVLYVTGPQCDMCRKLTRAAGIVRVVWPDGEEVF